MVYRMSFLGRNVVFGLICRPTLNQKKPKNFYKKTTFFHPWYPQLRVQVDTKKQAGWVGDTTDFCPHLLVTGKLQGN